MDRSLWLQCGCTALVAVGAAYASYRHGKEFALRFGADPTTAAIWPLIVDGLLMTATIELWKTEQDDQQQKNGRWIPWLAFLLGIGLSLCANVASAPAVSAFGIAVAACPPLALLLAVELLNRAFKRHRAADRETSTSLKAAETQASIPAHETAPTETTAIETMSPRPPLPEITETVDLVTGPAARKSAPVSERAHETEEHREPVTLAAVSELPPPLKRVTAEQRMWSYYRRELAQGRVPTGAELDRIAGTHNYGRRILRKWRERELIITDNSSPRVARAPSPHKGTGSCLQLSSVDIET